MFSTSTLGLSSKKGTPSGLMWLSLVPPGELRYSRTTTQITP